MKWELFRRSFVLFFLKMLGLARSNGFMLPDSRTAMVKRQASDNFTQRCDLSLILHHHYQSHRWCNNKIIHTFLYIFPLPSCSQGRGVCSTTSWQIRSLWCPGMVRHFCLHSLICVWTCFFTTTLAKPVVPRSRNQL